MTPQYTHHVGEKFYADSSARAYPGVTIICFASLDDAIYKAGMRLQAGLLAQPFGTKFALLPPTSFHMTVFSLILDAKRIASEWSSQMPLDTPLTNMDRFFSETVATVIPPAGFRMCMTWIGGRGLSFRLSPADEATYLALRNYRAQVSEATGVRHPDYETYEYHLTLAYQLQVLSSEEEAAFRTWRDAQGEVMRGEIGVFQTPPPMLTFFDDMFRFVPKADYATLTTR
jgi:hypothetical protein